MTTGRWKATAADLVSALREVYLPPGAIASGTDEWSFLTEVPSTGSPVHAANPAPALPAGASRDQVEAAWRDWRERGKVRNIDVLLVRNWRSGKVPYERVAVEVKVSRGDFRRDIPAKRAPWQALTHRFAYAVPEGLIAPVEVPAGCWLIEISEHPCDGTSNGHKHTPTRVHWNRKVKGDWNTAPALPGELFTAVARDASRARETIRSADDDGAAAKTADDLRRARNRIHALEARERANRDRYARLLDLVAPLLPQECADCGAPIKPAVSARYGHAEWAHKDTDTAAACSQVRAGAGRGWSGVEPATVRQERERASAEQALADTERAAYLRHHP